MGRRGGSCVGVFALVGLINAALYLSILPDRLTNPKLGLDAGDFLSALLTGGIPHPTGYPTYMILGRLFQLLPFGSPVWKAGLFSALCMAAASGLIAAWAGLFWDRITAHPAALAAGGMSGLAFGTAPLVFSHAVIVEVQGLQMLLLVCTLGWLTLNLFPTRIAAPRWVAYLLASVVGVSFGNHITLVLLLPLFVPIIWRAFRDPVARKPILIQLGLIGSGLWVYLYLPLAARQFPAINWGNPQTIAGFWWMISGTPYQGFLANPSLALIGERMRSLITIAIEQFGWLGLGMGIWGAVRFPSGERRMAWVLLYILSIYCAFSVLYASNDSVAYLLPALLMYALWIGAGVIAVWGRANIFHGRGAPVYATGVDTQVYPYGWRHMMAIHGTHVWSQCWQKLPWGPIIILGLGTSLLLRIPGVRAQVDPRAETQAADFAERLFKEAPQNALIITSASEDTFPVWYDHFGLGKRPDLRVIVLSLTQFTWYQQTLVRTYPDLSYPPLDAVDPKDVGWGEQIQILNPERPVCYSTMIPEAKFELRFECALKK
jgi:hypothetical protein